MSRGWGREFNEIANQNSICRALFDSSLQGHCRCCPLEAAVERRQNESAYEQGALELLDVKSL